MQKIMGHNNVYYNVHKLFEINDVVDMIFNYWTIGEIKLFQGKKCDYNDLCESIKSYLDCDLYEGANKLLTYIDEKKRAIGFSQKIFKLMFLKKVTLTT